MEELFVGEQTSAKAERELSVALDEIKRMRFDLINQMFSGTQLHRRGFSKDAEEAKKAAENAADVLKAIPGLDVSFVLN